MKLNIFIYCLKVWLTSVLLAPVFLVLGGFMFRANSGHLRLFYFLFLYGANVLLGFACSVPSMLIFGFVTYALAINSGSLFFKKSLLCIAGLLLTGLATMLIKKIFSGTELMVIASTYYLIGAFGIWFYQFKIVNDIPDITKPQAFNQSV